LTIGAGRGTLRNHHLFQDHPMRACIVVALTFVALVFNGPDTAHAQAAEVEVLTALLTFHEALEAGDREAALAMLAPDVRILEGGGVETKDHYASGHLGADMAFARAVPAERGEATVRVMDDVAWVMSTSTREGEYRGREIDSRGAELAVLIRVDGEWKIAAVSWS